MSIKMAGNLPTVTVSTQINRLSEEGGKTEKLNHHQLRWDFKPIAQGITTAITQPCTSRAAGQCPVMEVGLGIQLTTSDDHRQTTVACGRRRRTAGSAGVARHTAGSSRHSAGSAAGSRPAALYRRRPGH